MTTEELLPENDEQATEIEAALSPLFIPGQIEGIRNVDGTPNPNQFGINRSMCTSNANGLLVNVFPYLNAQANDNVRIFTSQDPVPLLSFNLREGQQNETSNVFLPGHLLKQGYQTLHYVVMRNSTNIGTSDLLPVFFRFLLPGGTDPQPDRPGHYRLLAPRLLNVPAGGITRQLAESADGVQFAIAPYPNMRQFDQITLSFGGVHFEVTVLLEQVDQEIRSKIPLDVILKAGNGDHVFIYKLLDEVHNRSSDWSLRTVVYTEVTPDLLRPVILDKVQVDPDTRELFYDLATLGSDDIQADVVTRPERFDLEDLVELFVTVIKDGVESVVFNESKPVTQIDSTVRFFVPNVKVVQLAREHIYFRYVLTKKSTGDTLRSSRVTVWLKGTAVNLPAPTILPIEGVVVDPQKAATVLVAPHAAIASQSWLHAYLMGTAPGGVVHPYDSGRRISSSQATRPMTFIVPAAYLSLIKGGPLSLHYTVGRSKDDPLAAESLRHSVRVGQPEPDLRAVDVVDAVDGVLDPDLLPPFADAEVQVPPFKDMLDHTVYLFYQSDNPLDPLRRDDSIDIDPRDVDSPVSFYLPQDYLRANVGYTLTIGYSVERTDGTGTERFGANAQVAIGASAKLPLPAPVVLEANAAGVVNPGDTADNGASVVIAKADLEFGDYIHIHWDGDDDDYVWEEPISGNGAGKPYTHQVPHKHVLANQDKTVRVSYRVERDSGGEQPSEVLLLSVQRSVLPLPAISEAKGPNLDQINPDDVAAAGANALIAIAAQLKEGDLVTLLPSGAPPIPKTVLKSDEGRVFTIQIPRLFIEQQNGRSFTLGYRIRRKAGGADENSEFKNFDVRRVIGSGQLKVMGARSNSNTYRSSSVPCLLWAFNAQTLQPILAEWRYVGDAAWVAGVRFTDTDSSRRLQVRSADDRVTLNPVNVCGNGVDSNISGAAAVVCIRDRRVVAGVERGRDLVSFGNPTYGAIPGIIAIQENMRNVFCSGAAYVALTEGGVALPFGDPGSGGGMGAVDPNGFTAIASNGYAFAGLKQNGDVFCWGHPSYGGNGSASGIKRLFNGGRAFCAERTNGAITAWGPGVAADPMPGITNVERIICSYQAFAAITTNKRLFAFGVPGYGNVIPPEILNRTDIQKLCCANAQAFVAMTTANNVVAWGSPTHGGRLTDYPGISTTLFIDVASTWHAFAGITQANRVAAWGPGPAGVAPAYITALTNAIQIVGNAHAFAVLCADGRVFAWGNATLGGDASAVAAQLINVVALYTSSQCFIALTSDKRVVVWGHPTVIAGAQGLNGTVSYLDDTAMAMDAASVEENEAVEPQ
ncbi:hypothetical protein [Pseudomonas fluorescens]|uniref:Uncharacterized protein n=1 Tax=Pseudomonas fluorescens TaxID=294 RepID=A0A423LLN1_PSEFL|nr:hypothetical protein [Pseudomonas fluorescens]RON69186.1 hypothetical protein BK671_07015 [Pseudomonas fluorescens]